jgi:hypothetical protein
MMVCDCSKQDVQAINGALILKRVVVTASCILTTTSSLLLVSNMGSSKVEACVELMIPLTPS